MKKHAWYVEVIDSGHLGVNDFWVCNNCGAAGGPVTTKEQSWNPFYADGSGLKVGQDCEESKKLIEEHLRKKNEKKTLVRD